MSIIRQTDLAALAGVSLKTVNRALAGHPDVSARTRDRVLALAAEHNYQPNIAAQTMRSGKTGYIGLLESADWQQGAPSSQLLGGIMGQTEALGLNLYHGRLPVGNSVNAEQFPDVLKKRMVDGLLVNYSFLLNDSLSEAFNRLKVPTIWMNIKREKNCIYPDDTGAGRAVADYLLSQGHNHILYAMNYSSRHYSSLDRWHGFRTRLDEAGIKPDVIGRDSAEGNTRLIQLFTDYLKTHKKLSAVVTYSLETASTIMYAAMRAGLRLPEDLELITYEIRFRNWSRLPIKYVSPPMKQLGRKAVQLLGEMIEHATDHPPVILPFDDNFKVYDLSDWHPSHSYINPELKKWET